MLFSNLEKNRHGLTVAMNFNYWFDKKKPLYRVFKNRDKNAEWLNIFFDACDKVQVVPDKETYDLLSKICSRKDYDEKENEKREAMLPILKQNFKRFYPNEKMPSDDE